MVSSQGPVRFRLLKPGARGYSTSYTVAQPNRWTPVMTPPSSVPANTASNSTTIRYCDADGNHRCHEHGDGYSDSNSHQHCHEHSDQHCSRYYDEHIDQYTDQYSYEHIDWHDGDLLVLGSSESGPVSRVFLGSRAAKIIRHAPVAVLVVPRTTEKQQR